METAGYIILFVYLFVMAIYDIRRKEIQLECSVVVAVLLAMIQVCLVFRGQEPVWAAFLGILIGVVLIGISILTKGEIGIGDGILFVISGLLFGIYENGVLLFLSLLFTAMASGILVLSRRVGRKYTLPFAPFVFAGYGVMCLWKLFG